MINDGRRHHQAFFRAKLAQRMLHQLVFAQLLPHRRAVPAVPRFAVAIGTRHVSREIFGATEDDEVAPTFQRSEGTIRIRGLTRFRPPSGVGASFPFGLSTIQRKAKTKGKTWKAKARCEAAAPAKNAISAATSKLYSRLSDGGYQRLYTRCVENQPVDLVSIGTISLVWIDTGTERPSMPSSTRERSAPDMPS